MIRSPATVERLVSLVLATLTVLTVVVLPRTASAHRLDALVRAQEREVVVEAFFADDTPARGARVQVHRLHDRPSLVAAGVTDEEGLFRFVPPAAVDLIVAVEDAEGHRAEIHVRGPSLRALVGRLAASAEDTTEDTAALATTDSPETGPEAPDAGTTVPETPSDDATPAGKGTAEEGTVVADSRDDHPYADLDPWIRVLVGLLVIAALVGVARLLGKRGVLGRRGGREGQEPRGPGDGT